MATRKKPKKADFVHNKKRYWFSDCNAVDISDSDNTTDYFLEATTLDYETDEEAPLELWNDDQFMEKHYNALQRVFPNMESELPWYEGY